MTGRRDPALERLTDGPGVQRFTPINPPSTPEPFRAGPGQHEENTMARPRKARDPDDSGGAIPTKDFEKAAKLYLEDIKPARSKASEFMQEISSAFKMVKKVCHIQPSAMKAAIKVEELEDAKREDWLRSFNGYLRARGIEPDPKDLVDAMEGKDRYARPKLVTLPHEGGDDDLANAGGEQAADEFEATPEELARQEGRKPSISKIASPAPLH